MKINLGCGSTPLKGYTNVDMDTLQQLRERYPNREFSDDLVIEQWDIFNLPVEDGSVDEIRADCLFEHLNFKEERLIFEESKRVLKTGGLLDISVPDFETLAKQWLEAEDNWQDWYRDDDEAVEQAHWFGTYEYSFKNRWGYVTASLFGSQNGEGQYHKNCYTIGKLKKIFDRLGFKMQHSETYEWPRGKDIIIKAIGQKI
jgi:predicted SAM-dependent methyltransferase